MLKRVDVCQVLVQVLNELIKLFTISRDRRLRQYSQGFFTADVY